MSRREAWAELAAGLEFELKPGVEGFLDSPAARREIEAQVASGGMPAQGLELLQSPLVRGLLDRLFDGVVVGRHRGFELNLFPSSERASSSRGSSTPYANVALFFPQSYALGLHVYEETFLSRVGKAIFFQQDVTLGNPQLDRLVMVKAKDGPAAQAVRALLGSEAVQQRLIEMFSSSSGWELRDHGVKHKEVAEAISVERARELMDMAVELATCLPPP